MVQTVTSTGDPDVSKWAIQRTVVGSYSGWCAR